MCNLQSWLFTWQSWEGVNSSSTQVSDNRATMNGTSMASNSSPTVSLGFLLVRSCSAMMSFTLLICCSAQRPKDNEQSQNEQLSHCRQNSLTCAFTSFTVNGVNLHFLSEVQPPQEQDNLKSMGRSIFGKALTLIPSSRGNLQSSLAHCNKSCPVESLSFALKTYYMLSVSQTQHKSCYCHQICSCFCQAAFPSSHPFCWIPLTLHELHALKDRIVASRTRVTTKP